ncbi:hypothetical protein FISHEDRAFT_78046 [Fistulina hepatica ATCC 64428]|nr:hypothetical protein FISHEDRAFT_78046 [Fistulina hepatica ATCC 64428]
MFKRHFNPCILLDDTKIVSRQELEQDSEDEVTDESELAPLRKRLHDMIESKVVYQEIHRPTKCRKLGSMDNNTLALGGPLQTPTTVDSEEFVAASPDFRLLSATLPPRQFLLAPKPAPPPKVVTREPEYEDSDEAAQSRQWRAESVAVDFAWLLRESKIPYKASIIIHLIYVSHPLTYWQSFPSASTKHSAVRLETSAPSSSFMVLERRQKPRRTRPPVASADLDKFPYMEDGDVLPSASSNARCCPVISIRSE